MVTNRKELVLTKTQGSLRVKDLLTLKGACYLRLIQIMFFIEDSVWASWFKEVILKGLVHNYWTIKPSSSNLWLVNKLIKLHTVVFP